MFVLNLFAKFINFILTVIELILCIRFVLIFFNVESFPKFSAWIYGASNSLVAPFGSIFQQLKFLGFVIDFSTLFALIVYGLVGMLIVKLISHPTSYN